MQLKKEKGSVNWVCLSIQKIKEPIRDHIAILCSTIHHNLQQR